MLSELRIRNFAIIESLALPLAPGFNALTGETGAGKSIIVGALGLLLGERANADVIRSGADRATVEGTFDVADQPEIRALLDQHGIDAEDSLVVLKRDVTGGRARAWINGTPVTASILAEVGRTLVNIHGQHEAQTLLDAAAQRRISMRSPGRTPMPRVWLRAHAELTATIRETANLSKRRVEASAAPTTSGMRARSATPSWSMAKTHGSRTRLTAEKRDELGAGGRTRLDARRRRGCRPPATGSDLEALVVDPADRPDVVAVTGDVRLGLLRDRSAGPRADRIRGDDRPRPVASRRGQAAARPAVSLDEEVRRLDSRGPSSRRRGARRARPGRLGGHGSERAGVTNAPPRRRVSSARRREAPSGRETALARAATRCCRISACLDGTSRSR